MKSEREPEMIIMGGVDCTPEVETRFNQWYDETHIPILMKSGEIERVKRFKRIGDDENYPKYLIVYELANWEAYERYENSPAKAEAMAEMKESWSTGGAKRRWRALYEVITTIEK